MGYAGGGRVLRGGRLHCRWWLGRLWLAGGGRGPRGGRLRCRWRRGRLWLVGRWADAVGGDGLRDERAVRGLALTSLLLLEWSGRSDWTGSRGPVRETREGPGRGTLPTDGAVRPVGRDRFTRTGAGDRARLVLTPCPLVGGPAGRIGPVHADRCGRRGRGVREALAAPFYRRIAAAAVLVGRPVQTGAAGGTGRALAIGGGGSRRRRQKRPEAAEAVGGTGSGGVANDWNAENARSSDTNLMQHRINETSPSTETAGSRRHRRGRAAKT